MSKPQRESLATRKSSKKSGRETSVATLSGRNKEVRVSGEAPATSISPPPVSPLDKCCVRLNCDSGVNALFQAGFTGISQKTAPRFGEFCSCCYLPLLPQLGCSIHATLGPPFSLALHCLQIVPNTLTKESLWWRHSTVIKYFFKRYSTERTIVCVIFGRCVYSSLPLSK